MLDCYQPFDPVVYRLADGQLQLIDRGVWTVLQAVIDNALRRCITDMKIQSHFVRACCVDVDELTRGS